MAAPGKNVPRLPAFSVQPIEQVGGKRLFYKLFKHDSCQFDDFISQLAAEGTYTHDLGTLFNTLDQLARLRPIRGTKHHALGEAYTHQAHGVTIRVREWEVKTKQLRLYYIHLPPTDDVVVFFGKKNTQVADISQFQSLVKQYLDFLCAARS